MDVLRNIIAGSAALADVSVLVMLIGAVVIGILVGAIPGLTATLAIALLLPFTFGLDPLEGIAVLMGIYVGGIYGGSVTAMMVRIPGAPANALTMLDGHPMVRSGNAEAALGLGLVSSVGGGLIGGIVLLSLAPQLAQISLRFQSPEMFALILLALVLLAVVSTDSVKRGLAATLIGLMIATIGLDPLLPVPRFTLGSYELLVGLPLLPLVVGLFALAEIIDQADRRQQTIRIDVRPRASRILACLPYLRAVGPKLFLKSSLIGSFVGCLPGGGAAVASFAAYGEAKRTSKHPERFGTGIPEGIIAPEAANNAMIGGALVPMLAFGIPGDAVTAVILGALLIQGVIPGPQLLTSSDTILAPLVAAYFLCNVMLLICGALLLPAMASLTRVSRPVLVAVIGSVAIVAGYASEGTIFAIAITVGVGLLGFVLMRAGIPVVPVLLGAILGPMLEINFRRSLILSEGSLLIFVRSPISFVLLALTALVLLLKARRRGGRQPGSAPPIVPPAQLPAGATLPDGL